ncbi:MULTISPECIES: ribonuclease HII [unclassified Petrotoga]|jgi:ribonuclease HII|uniref:ribonuclease HII n=1 Tax=unclassified Petrotoga TaxID=2620614 RepID=UPI000EF167B8|nr:MULTISPECIES: ribonuclease HII [unclassified Petrotoga]
MKENIEITLLNKYKKIIGIDEAGRGPLAGPVFVGAVVIESKKEGELLAKIGKDSKSLSPKQRERRYFQITRNFKYYSNFSTSQLIDEINIFKATELAMIKLLEKIVEENANDYYVIIDGKFFKLDYNYDCIVKGDQTSPLIGAASIVAKYERDIYMNQLHELYPNYGFITHKGYPTRKHIENIKKYGIISEHRKTFNPIKRFIEEGIL